MFEHYNLLWLCFCRTLDSAGTAQKWPGPEIILSILWKWAWTWSPVSQLSWTGSSHSGSVLREVFAISSLPTYRQTCLFCDDFSLCYPQLIQGVFLLFRPKKWLSVSDYIVNPIKKVSEFTYQLALRKILLGPVKKCTLLVSVPSTVYWILNAVYWLPRYWVAAVNWNGQIGHMQFIGSVGHYFTPV